MRRRRKLRATQRGHYYFGPSELTSGDLFGLYTRTRKIERHSWSIVVYPQTVVMPELMLPSARPIGDVRSKLPLWQDPTRPAGIREYRPGDPVRNIDWKATARRGELYVRQFDPSVSQYALILVEGAVTEKPWEGFRLDVLEAVASCAASVSIRAIDMGFRTGLVVNSALSLGGQNVVRPAGGHAHLPALLESLAMMRPITVTPLDELARSRARDTMPSGATIIFVTGQMRDAAVGYVSDLARRGHPVLVLWVGREDPPELRGLRVLDYRSVFGVVELLEGESIFDRPRKGPQEAEAGAIHA